MTKYEFTVTTINLPTKNSNKLDELVKLTEDYNGYEAELKEYSNELELRSKELDMKCDDLGKAVDSLCVDKKTEECDSGVEELIREGIALTAGSIELKQAQLEKLESEKKEQLDQAYNSFVAEEIKKMTGEVEKAKKMEEELVDEKAQLKAELTKNLEELIEMSQQIGFKKIVAIGAAVVLAASALFMVVGPLLAVGMILLQALLATLVFYLLFALVGISGTVVIGGATLSYYTVAGLACGCLWYVSTFAHRSDRFDYKKLGKKIKKAISSNKDSK